MQVQSQAEGIAALAASQQALSEEVGKSDERFELMIGARMNKMMETLTDKVSWFIQQTNKK